MLYIKRLFKIWSTVTNIKKLIMIERNYWIEGNNKFLIFEIISRREGKPQIENSKKRSSVLGSNCHWYIQPHFLCYSWHARNYGRHNDKRRPEPENRRMGNCRKRMRHVFGLPSSRVLQSASDTEDDVIGKEAYDEEDTSLNFVIWLIACDFNEDLLMNMR